MASKPRQILPGRTWFVTSRAIFRQHRFVPKKEVVRTIWYCLGVAAERYQVQLHAFCWMSNHYHILLTDLGAELPDFMRDLNSLTSKALNALRGTRDENFTRRGYNAVLVTDAEKMLHHSAYTEANPCNANLVRYAWQWESVTSAKLRYGQTKEFRRPTDGLWNQAPKTNPKNMDRHRARHRGRIRCPEVASVRLVRPPCSPQKSNTEVRHRVSKLENQAQKARTKLRHQVMGMQKAKQVSCTDAPTSKEGFFATIPKVSGKNPEQRSAAELAYRTFVSIYRQALEHYRETGESQFPEGTWWMRRCLHLPCLPCPSG